MTDLTDRRSDPSPGSGQDPPVCEGDLAHLLEQSAAGDEQAFAALYDTTSRFCFGLALRILRDEAAAEQVVRDAYLHVWTHSVRYDPAEGSAIAWITRLVHRRAVACARHEASPAGNGAPPAGFEPDPATVPDSPREAVERAYFGARTWCEVAAEEHITLDAAAARIRDGLLEL